MITKTVRYAKHKLSGVLPHRPPKLRQWTLSDTDRPWYDQRNPMELLEQRRRREQLSDTDHQHLATWATDGYCLLPKAVDEKLIDEMLPDLEGIWTAERPIDGLLIGDLKRTPEGPPTTISHEEILALGHAERFAMRDWSSWRVHSFFAFSRSANTIFQNPELTRVASLVFDRQAEPGWSINFMYGSAQSLHQDTAVFHIFPPNYILGAWIACEDISPDSGPLVFYPKSHQAPLYPKFDNYPQTNLRTASPEVTADYQRYVDQLSERYERKTLIASKGDVFFWHSQVIHGGSEIRDHSLTRKSYVLHFVPPGMNVKDKMIGPFNW